MYTVKGSLDVSRSQGELRLKTLPFSHIAKQKRIFRIDTREPSAVSRASDMQISFSDSEAPKSS